MRIVPFIAVVTAVVLISGCSQRPMKLTQVNHSVTPILIKENSSGALKLLHEQGAYTVRDLTKEEFEAVQDDVIEYMRTNEVFESQSGTGVGYAAGSTAVGTGLGLSFEYASGVALLGVLSKIGSAGYEGENYPFAWDYSSKHFLIRKHGDVDIDLLGNTAELVVNKYAAQMTDLYKTTITESKGLVKSDSKWIPETDVSYTAITNFSRSDRARVGGAVLVRFQCPIKGEKTGQFCTATFSIRSSNDRYPLANSMREEFMRTLGEDYAVYIPPNTAYKNVPSILHGSGKIEYLVEK